MTQELSTTEAKLAEQATKELLPKGRVYAFNIGWQGGFDDGIDYALSHILPSRMIGFVEWVAKNNYWHSPEGAWADWENNIVAETTAELYQKHITEYLKQQQDE